LPLNPLISSDFDKIFLPMHGFVTSFIDHLENISSLNYADLPVLA
jgi:hypothetical protein